MKLGGMIWFCVRLVGLPDAAALSLWCEVDVALLMSICEAATGFFLVAARDSRGLGLVLLAGKCVVDADSLLLDMGDFLGEGPIPPVEGVLRFRLDILPAT